MERKICQEILKKEQVKNQRAQVEDYTQMRTLKIQFIKFATPTDARKTVAKVKKVSKPFARKIQILTVGEQRAKVMGKSKVAAIFKKGKDAIRRTNNRK